MKAEDFKQGMEVEVADCYLEDEVTENHNTSKIAIVHSEPSDDEELVSIQYESGEIDFVPQWILEPHNENPMCKKYIDSEALPDEDGNCSLCGGDCVDA